MGRDAEPPALTGELHHLTDRLLRASLLLALILGLDLQQAEQRVDMPSPLFVAADKQQMDPLVGRHLDAGENGETGSLAAAMTESTHCPLS